MTDHELSHTYWSRMRQLSANPPPQLTILNLRPVARMPNELHTMVSMVVDTSYLAYCLVAYLASCAMLWE